MDSADLIMTLKDLKGVEKELEGDLLSLQQNMLRCEGALAQVREFIRYSEQKVGTALDSVVWGTGAQKEGDQ